jgi:hypothetical protein
VTIVAFPQSTRFEEQSTRFEEQSTRFEEQSTRFEDLSDFRRTGLGVILQGMCGVFAAPPNWV